MKKNYFFKYSIFFAIFSIITLSFVYIISAKKVKEHYIKTLTLNLTKISETLIPSLQTYLITKDYKGLDNFVKNIGQKIEMRLTIIDKNGKVIADSKSNPANMENHRNRIEVEQALKGNIGTSIRYSSTVNEDMLYVAVSIKQENNINYVLRISMFLKDINLLVSELRKDLLLSLITFSAGILIIFFIFFTKWTNSTSYIIKFSKQIAEGNFPTTLLTKPSNEFKDLTDSLNYMNDKIKELFKELREEKEQLQIVINSINELLFVIDSTGKIVICNNSFKEISKDINAEGRYYWEVIRNNELTELIKKIQEGLDKKIVELELFSKVYSCSFAKLELRNEIVFILTDITHYYRLDKMKKELVENVSHELRTPLTVIKGFVETLEQEADQKYQNYLNIIKKNTERLIKIVNDLLTLSYFENKSILIVFKKVNLVEIVKNVELLFQKSAKAKNLYLHINIEEDLPEIEGDEIQLENMLINLIENAINYTEEGGITINLKKENNYILLEVNDTGIGIPNESIDRIFERFYVVDRSRSRKSAGSGLGLSIVKHIVLAHNGSINVKSELGKGTTFIIKLKI